MVNGKESDPYKETQERNVRVFNKLKVNDDPASKNMPYESLIRLLSLSVYMLNKTGNAETK